MEESYRKDLSHITWDEVFARQVRRAGLVEEWMEALHLQPGARVLDIGAGPGYVSFVLADRVGHDGLVYAADRSADALAYLERLKHERGVTQIQGIVGDATTLDPGALRPDSALVTMVLHHTDDPPGILANVARLLPAGALAVVAEFHPEGPCEQGPPQSERLPPEQVREWCEAAGFEVLTYRRQTPEHYMWTVQRRP
ncbi:MAG: methyltransferase domain-containing protein [candidate division NC10 bacterium]|nr:methyltransferase domain-containing protein [candidate division NC10 bacterium]MBI2457026.1 methyltransferase domain-containing protein [candidate division NC10 bacterium]